MKIVHQNKEEPKSTGEWLAKAREHESAKEWKEAIAAYNKVIRSNELHEESYDRLMIIYRKIAEPGKELAIIRKGIAAFRKFYDNASRKKPGKRIISLSRALLKSTGLADAKGNPVYEREPIGKWTRRKLIVEKKLDKK